MREKQYIRFRFVQAAVYPNFNAKRRILFYMTSCFVLKNFAWVLRIFFGRRIGGLNVIMPEGLGVTEGTV